MTSLYTYPSTALPALSFPIFLPTIINGFGFSYTNAQLLSIAPNATGFVCTLAVCVLSDRLQARGPFVVAGSAVAIAGSAMVLATRTPAAQYAGTVVVAAGLLPSVACQLAWMGGTFGEEVKRAVAIAIIVGSGNLGGCVSDRPALGASLGFERTWRSLTRAGRGSASVT